MRNVNRLTHREAHILLIGIFFLSFVFVHKFMFLSWGVRMDILSDVFICGIQTLLITIICTIFELSRFELTTKQLLLIFLIYYLNVGLIVFALFLPMLDWNICAETMHELYMQYGSTLLLSSISIYLLVVVCLIFFSCKILVKIRGKD